MRQETGSWPHGWQPDWHNASDAPAFQERYAPTCDAAGKKTQAQNLNPAPVQNINPAPAQNINPALARRRLTDARLWAQMTPAQERAALEIADVYAGMTRGLGYGAQDWERLPGSKGMQVDPAGIKAVRIAAYRTWAAACRARQLSHSVVADVLVFGHACHTLDRARRVRKGATRHMLLAALQLYADLRGWQ